MTTGSTAPILEFDAESKALIGASSVRQLEENVASLNNLRFSEAELAAIETILNA